MKNEFKILIVDDEVDTLKALEMGLEKEGYELDTTTSYQQALNILKKEEIDIVVTDLKLKDGSGLDILNFINSNQMRIPVIIVTAYGSVESAIEAIRGGAYDYVVKPFRFADLKRLLNRLEEMITLKRENERLKKILKGEHGFPHLIGVNPAFRQLREVLKQIAPSRSTVLITGETGTGKEIAAEFIHYYSNRSDKSLVKINCGAIPETLLEAELFGYERGAFTGAVKMKKGKIEMAEGGTLFLDEVGNLTSSMQVKLLRVLQSGEFERLGSTKNFKADVRFIAATNDDLEKRIDEETFREDLYYRLNVINIQIPPLRERIEDIPFLVQHFIEKYNQLNLKTVEGIEPDVLKVMMNYSWRGNIRELENMIERAVVLSQEKILDLHHFPVLEEGSIENFKNLTIEIGMPLAEVEKTYIKKALTWYNNDKPKIAKALSIGLATLYRKIKEYNLE